MNNKDWRQRLYVMVFQADTPAGRRFDTTLLLIILCSLVVVVLDSINSIHRDYADLLAYIEWGFTFVFAVEYGLRLYCSPRPLRYAFSFYGLVDLRAIVPGILAIYYSDAQYLLIIRIIRMLRIFRVLKLAPYLSQANYLLSALRGSKQKIIVFLVSVSTLVTVFGTLMYVVEGPENGFTSIPISIYWAIVTMTTVGYGDITPATGLGKFLSACVMLIGYTIIAVPTGIVSASMMKEYKRRRDKECPNCHRSGHEDNAEFCKYCGHSLNPSETKAEEK